MKPRTKKIKFTILILAIYQIAGGIVGFGVIAWLLLKTEMVNGAILLMFLLAVGLYAFSIKSGSLLLRRKYKRGLIYSITNQGFQLIAIGTGAYKYDFYSGAKATIGFNFTEGFSLKFDVGLTSEFNFAINTNDTEYFLYLNLLAVFLLLVLGDIYKKVVLRKEKNKVMATKSLDDSEGAPL